MIIFITMTELRHAPRYSPVIEHNYKINYERIDIFPIKQEQKKLDTVPGSAEYLPFTCNRGNFDAFNLAWDPEQKNWKMNLPKKWKIQGFSRIPASVSKNVLYFSRGSTSPFEIQVS